MSELLHKQEVYQAPGSAWPSLRVALLQSIQHPPEEFTV